jgi:hypothetical protein
MDVNEVRCEDMDWIHLDLDSDQLLTLVNTVMKVSSGSITLENVGFSVSLLFHGIITIDILFYAVYISI